MKSLIIGNGEVGSSLFKILSPHHHCFIRDIDDVDLPGVEVLHICYPDSDRFIEHTRRYIAEYKPKMTIIHSSVPPGRTRLLCIDQTDAKEYIVLYSPIRGRHRPDLAAELKAFPKFVAGQNKLAVKKAVAYFEKCGWQSIGITDVEGLELCKLLSNIHMGLEIAWAQEVKRLFREFKANHMTYGAWEDTYMAGYDKLKQPFMRRPIMRTDPIGGHCILECTDILAKKYHSLAFEFIRRSNDEAKYEKGEG